MKTVKKIRRKLNSKAGFTLAETMIAVLILLMVSAIMAGGIPVAKNAYERVVRESNGELLMSTTISTLRNELGMADNVEIKDGNKTVVYDNETVGATSSIWVNGSGVIMYQRYADTDMSVASDAVPLISTQVTTKDLKVTFDSISYDETNGVITISNLSVKDSHNREVTGRGTVSIRVISYDNS